MEAVVNAILEDCQKNDRPIIFAARQHKQHAISFPIERSLEMRLGGARKA